MEGGSCDDAAPRALFGLGGGNPARLLFLFLEMRETERYALIYPDKIKIKKHF